MNFLADQNFPRTCAPLIREYGHTYCDLSLDPELGIEDQVLFEKAQALNAVFLTTDKDFFHTIPLLYAEHAGVIVVNLARPNRAQILEKLQWALEFIKTHPIPNHVLLLRDHRVLYSKRILEA